MDQPFTTTPRKIRPVNRLSFSERILSSGKDVLSLTKPGINLSNLFACMVGYWLASGGIPEWRSLSWALLGTALVVGGSCALNNGIDRDFDRKMERTRHRPVPSGRVSRRAAVLLGLIFAGAGVWSLSVGVNLLAAWLRSGRIFSVCGRIYFMAEADLTLQHRDRQSVRGDPPIDRVGGCRSRPHLAGLDSVFHPVSVATPTLFCFGSVENG